MVGAQQIIPEYIECFQEKECRSLLILIHVKLPFIFVPQISLWLLRVYISIVSRAKIGGGRTENNYFKSKTQNGS